MSARLKLFHPSFTSEISAISSLSPPQVVNQCIDHDDMIRDYESLTSDLLEWIENTITHLNDREFANSLLGIQQQLSTFNTYRTVEKPPK